MGTHIRSVMSKIILITLVASLIFNESLGSGYEEVELCEDYQKDLQKDDEKYGAKYKYMFTPKKSNYDNARRQCAEMGGDLVSFNLGPEGKRYHHWIHQYVHSRNEPLWIGLTDRGFQMDWRLTTNFKSFNTTDPENVFQWGRGEPNNWNGPQDCVLIKQNRKQMFEMDDEYCHREFLGLCDIKMVNCN